MAELTEEKLRLKHLVAELMLDKTMLQNVLSKSVEAIAAWIDGGEGGWELPAKGAASHKSAAQHSRGFHTDLHMAWVEHAVGTFVGRLLQNDAYC
jgi:hypothetical protein